MKNEPISFQIAFRADVIGEYIPVSVSASSELPISAYKMVNLPVTRSVTF